MTKLNKEFTPQLQLIKKHIKDLSFENPQSISLVSIDKSTENINLDFSVISKPFDKDHIEVILKIKCNCSHENKFLFCLELDYLGFFKKLNSLNICHFDIHEGNILYNTENNHSYIIDFGLSIDMKKLKKNNNYEDYFFRYINHNYWCIDIIIMNYVINMKKTIKNKNEAKKIVKMFMRSDFFTNCSNNFKKLYSDECLKYVSLFIDKSIPYVKNNLIKNWKTWDIFSLSILFIEFQNLLNDKNKGFIEILFECIHPNPKKRLNYDELLKKLKNI